MPTYQYACTACSHELEAVQSFSDDPLTVCPECAGRLRKVFSAVGVVFKGSGFYRTDSRAGNGSNGGDGAKKSEGASESAKSEKTSSKSSDSSGSDKGGSAKGKSDTGSSSGSGSSSKSAASTSS